MTDAARQAWGTTFFADDIRFELGGKYSIVGIYNVTMVIPAVTFPVTVPKLCMLVRYQEVRGAFSDDVIVKVYFPGDNDDNPSFSTTIPGDGRDGANVAPNIDDTSERVLTFTVPLVFVNMTIKEAGKFKVRFECGGTVTKLGMLVVSKVDPSEANPPTD